MSEPTAELEIPLAARSAFARQHNLPEPTDGFRGQVNWDEVDRDAREIAAPVVAAELRRQAEDIAAIVRQTWVGRNSTLSDAEQQIYARLFQVLSERADELDGRAADVVGTDRPVANAVTCPVCGRPDRKLTKTGKLQPHSDQSKKTQLPYGIRCTGSGKTLAELSR